MVDEDEFERIYSRFQAGKYQFDITQTEFDVEEYTRFCDSVADETAEFQARQEEATAIETEKFAAPTFFWFHRLANLLLLGRSAYFLSGTKKDKSNETLYPL